ncbi:hypothetical protein [Oceanobacter mangrovi]|uniref:hypothetical protein n=1 Tax=Oceanobacter mangrovi TaxID=2862510 RepID=UPI001C8DAA0E|nr:hypothetical protein [Oceanobacter mangrovi]
MNGSAPQTNSIYVANLIERYLLTHPDAMDNFDGIWRWWITQQKLYESANSVKEALDILVDKGIVVEVENGFFKYVESHNPRNCREQ